MCLLPPYASLPMPPPGGRGRLLGRSAPNLNQPRGYEEDEEEFYAQYAQQQVYQSLKR